jgi:hypothetical protein
MGIFLTTLAKSVINVEVCAVLHNSNFSTQTEKVPDVPSARSCQETNVGDARTLILATGVYIMHAWSSAAKLA